MRYYWNLSKRFMIISWHNIYTFKFELFMVLINLIFNLSFVIIFWYSLMGHINSLGGWTFAELAMLSAITLMGEGLGGIFFGFRDLPGKIIGGELDKYLTRPVNTLYAVLFEQLSIIYFIQQFLLSSILIMIIKINYNLSFSFYNIALSFIVLLLGVLIFNFIYGTITFLAFWFGRLDVFRGLILGLTESKQYPLNIFPKKMQSILTYIIPIAFISYYPAGILLEKISIDFPSAIRFFVFFIFSLFLFYTVWSLGIKRYESNGG